MACNQDCGQGDFCNCAEYITPADPWVMFMFILICIVWFVFGMIGIATVLGWLR